MTKILPQSVAEFFRQSGRKGGKIGGKRSLQTMTAEQRSERARKAAAASAEARRNPWRDAIIEDTPGPLPVPMSKAQALTMADAILNGLTGYACKGSRAREDVYRRDLNWIAEVLLRVEAGESDPLRPTGNYR